MSLQALIFDVDGTLADTEREGHRIAFNEVFKKNNLDWFWDEKLYGELLSVTGGKERMKYYLDKYNTQFAKPENYNEFIQNLHSEKNTVFVDLLRNGKIGLRVGVKRIIAEAQEAGLRLAIATTTSPENIHNLLVATLGKESLAWFDVIAAGDIVPAKKPAPDIYTYTLAQMGINADQAIALEDSENGIKSSLAANLKTVVTVNDYTLKHDFTGASLVVDCFGDASHAMQVIAGESFGKNMIDIELLKNIANA